MTNKRIEELLYGIQKILADSRCDDWADIFSRVIDSYHHDPDSTRVQMRQLYGGMGSFNDLVLSSDGQPLIEENNRLDAMRKELYQEIKYSSRQ